MNEPDETCQGCGENEPAGTTDGRERLCVECLEAIDYRGELSETADDPRQLYPKRWTETRNGVHDGDMAQTTSPAGAAGPTAQEALMTTQTHPITPAVRFDVDRQRQSLEPGSLLRRALDKAQHIESRPANYTEPMLRWAEQLMTDTYVGRYAGLDEQAELADEAGWLA